MKIVLGKNQNVFFTSDTHFGHKNICRGTSSWVESNTRPFDTPEEMNERLLEGINDHVLENDHLFHLGDFSFDGFENIEHFRKRINCRNLHIILGNHDHHILKNHDNIRSVFSTVNDYVNLQLNIPDGKTTIKHNFVLFHYPIASWDGLRTGTIHLHGHVHFKKDRAVGQGRMLDVGMDGNDLDVWSLESILRILEERPKISMFEKDQHVKY